MIELQPFPLPSLLRYKELLRDSEDKSHWYQNRSHPLHLFRHQLHIDFRYLHQNNGTVLWHDWIQFCTINWKEECQRSFYNKNIRLYINTDHHTTRLRFSHQFHYTNKWKLWINNSSLRLTKKNKRQTLHFVNQIWFFNSL